MTDNGQAKNQGDSQAIYPPPPFPQRLKRQKLDKQFEKFLNVFKKLHINIPFAEVLENMPSVSIMLLSIAKKIRLNEIQPTTVSLQLADRTIRHPVGIIEDVLVKVGHFYIPMDFIVLEMEEDLEILLILGRPFLATASAIIDVREGKITFKVREEEVEFNIFNANKNLSSTSCCYRMELIDEGKGEPISPHTIEQAPIFEFKPPPPLVRPK
ncbi:PREDICTED: uncharacterized protein LOC108662816 [Theobroma cacao]|uniref:Uncharacterized protein LOC108662816 n=1 Tax=Theobroma cacao TaxID=3641 RepID=A0AB32WM87_THECC|nr:PREDICTED: uncharacterized protein LOC108662816 [Theobroma cacao]